MGQELLLTALNDGQAWTQGAGKGAQHENGQPRAASQLGDTPVEEQQRGSLADVKDRKTSRSPSTG